MTSSKKPPSKFDRLMHRMQRYPSEGRLVLMRNLAFGGAAVCLAILIQILQVGVKDDALKVSVFATAVGMPSWLGVGSLYESYILLGPRSYPHLRGTFGSEFIGGMGAISGIALLLAVGGVLWHLLPEAAYVFMGVAVFVLLLILAFHAHLAYWWFGAKGPGAIDLDVDT